MEVVVERTDASLSLDSTCARDAVEFVTSSRPAVVVAVAVGGTTCAGAGREALAESRARFGCLSLFERARSVQTNRR